MAIIEIKVPDIGNFDSVDVIEVAANVGDSISLDQSLITLESDKASMDIPSSAAGKLLELLVKVGDKIKEGDVIARLETSGANTPSAVVEPAPAAKVAQTLEVNPVAVEAVKKEVTKANNPSHNLVIADFSKVHATPSVRAFARELGADLNQIQGSGPKNRILREDVLAFTKSILSAGNTITSNTPATNGSGLNLIPWPKVDFSKFGAFEAQPLSRIQKLSGANLARNWAMIPHVTQFDEADVTDLEDLRVLLNKENEKSGAKVTMLAFLIKACVNALQTFPTFNSSLEGENLILKKYYHIGFAADTPNGLVVPVIRDCDKKSVMQIAKEMGELAKLAREGKLKPDQMQGGCFTISSLGGIGGTAFTPIINAPEVAILGVSRAQIKPIWNGKKFKARLMMPLSLSYDHRVIDGAAGAKFITHLNKLLADMRRVLV